VFVPKRKAGDRRKFRTEKLHHLCTSPDFVQKFKQAGFAVHEARMGKKKNLYRVFEGKPERKNIRKK
jgi:cation diffusion facilitator CzcD-associated flavoprotein CzcO